MSRIEGISLQLSATENRFFRLAEGVVVVVLWVVVVLSVVVVAVTFGDEMFKS